MDAHPYLQLFLEQNPPGTFGWTSMGTQGICLYCPLRCRNKNIEPAPPPTNTTVKRAQTSLAGTTHRPGRPAGHFCHHLPCSGNTGPFHALRCGPSQPSCPVHPSSLPASGQFGLFSAFVTTCTVPHAPQCLPCAHGPLLGC